MNTELTDIKLGIKRTLKLINSQEKKLLLVAVSTMAITGFLTNFPALVIGKLVDQMQQAQNFSFTQAFPFILLVLLTFIIREALIVIRKLIIENIATQTEKKQTIAVVSHLLKSDLAFLSSQQIGSLHGKVIRSIQGLVRMIKLTFMDFTPAVFGALAAICLALYQKPLIATIMILVIPTSLYIIFKQIASQKGIRVSLLRGKEKIDGTVVEMLGGIEAIRTADTTNNELSKIEIIAESLRLKEIKHHLSMAFYDAIKQLNEGFFYILVISTAIYLSTQGLISQGDILVYSILFVSITNPLREIHRILDQAHEGSILVNDLYELLEQPIDQSFNNLEKHTNEEESNDLLCIKNVSFTFPNQSTPILKEINLVINKGEKIGIVGASGCGKSTLVKIVLRLLHNYKGTITLSNKNLKSLSRKELANYIAYIPQKPYIFSGTIKENINYESKSSSEEDIIEAAKLANIYEEIIDKLGGLNGKVTENGNNLSGGQRQRIAIARLILKSPEIFIFDEATSALDNKNEEIIQKNLESKFKNTTMIIIAHRLSTLKNTDRIIVFEKGLIVQEGEYNSLAHKNGLFKEFLEGKTN